VTFSGCKDKSSFDLKPFAKGYKHRLKVITKLTYAKVIYELGKSTENEFVNYPWSSRLLVKSLKRDFAHGGRRIMSLERLGTRLGGVIEYLRRDSRTKHILQPLLWNLYKMRDKAYYTYDNAKFWKEFDTFKKKFLSFKQCFHDRFCKANQLCCVNLICIEKKYFPGYRKPASRPVKK